MFYSRVEVAAGAGQQTALAPPKKPGSVHPALDRILPLISHLLVLGLLLGDLHIGEFLGAGDLAAEGNPLGRTVHCTGRRTRAGEIAQLLTTGAIPLLLICCLMVSKRREENNQ